MKTQLKKTLLLNKKTILLLTIVFIVALTVRIINFRQSVYFGYDEARDAYDSVNIYTKGDIKLSGPPASAFKGINHGPIYLYFIGPLFLLGRGDPYFVSVFFRIINALGIFLVFFLGRIYFGKFAGIFSAILFAFSYEQYIYAIFTGNPALSNTFWPVLFIGAGIVYKYPKRRMLGLFMMIFSASLIAQFDLILAYAFLVVAALLFLLRSKIKGMKLSDRIKAVGLGLLPIITYPLAEFKNNFLGLKTFYSILTSDFSTVGLGQSKWSIYFNNFLGLFKDNVFELNFNIYFLWLAFGVIIFFLFSKIKTAKAAGFVLLWIFSLSSLLPTNGFMPYYSYAGVGIGVIVAFGFLLQEIFRRNKVAAIMFLSVSIFSNLIKIIPQSKDSLIMEIKAQPHMNLDDEISLIKRIYDYSNGKAFTIRTTTMPYKVQTTWSYLFDQYGVNTYGYKPFLEGGNTLGYPGEFPEPRTGTTCKRFLIREPVRGIPEVLIKMDVNEENNFSDIIFEENFGEILLEIREAKSKDCHN